MSVLAGQERMKGSTITLPPEGEGGGGRGRRGRSASLNTKEECVSWGEKQKGKTGGERVLSACKESRGREEERKTERGRFFS